MEPVEVQLYSLAGTVISGLVIGFLFDLYRIVRMAVRPKKFFTMAGDLLFGFLAAAVTFFLLLYSNWGEFRFYVFLGMLIGCFCYYKILSKTIVGWLVRLCRRLQRILRKLRILFHTRRKK